MGAKPEVSIRRAEPSDEGEVWELVKDFVISFTPEEEAFHATYPALLTEENAIFLVAAQEAEIVGYLLAYLQPTFYANGPMVFVQEIMVRESVRRKGVGGMLMSEAERIGVANGAKVIALATRRAGSFYSAIGYEQSAAYFRKTL